MESERRKLYVLRKILLIVLLFSSSILFGQQGDILVESRVIYSFTGPSDSILAGKVIIIRNTEGYIISKIKYQDGKKILEEEYKYDPDDYLISHSYYKWYSSYNDWKPEKKFEYGHDQNGYVDTLVSFRWNVSDDEWQPDTQRISIKDTTGHVILQETSIWNQDSSVWMISKKTEQKFNTSGDLLSITVTVWDDDLYDWIFWHKSVYSYNPNRDLISKVRYTWDSTEETWTEQVKEEYGYGMTGNVISHIVSNWDPVSGGWTIYQNDSYEFDPDGNITLGEGYTWYPCIETWRGYFKNNYEYDLDGRLILHKKYAWDEYSHSFEDFQVINYIYNDSGAIRAIYIDRYDSSVGNYLPHEHIHYYRGSSRMEYDSICEGDSLFWQGNYYVSGGMHVVSFALPSGGDSTAVLSLTVHAAPRAFVITGDASVHDDSNYSYHVPEDENINYSWSVENGNIIMGPSEYSTEIQWGSPGTGKIKVWGTDARGCRSDTVTLVVSISSTGILHYQQRDYHVYPVPARDRIWVSNLGSALDYTILGVTGQLVASGRLGVNGTINIEKLPAGTYFMILTERTAIKHSEVFIKH